MPDTTPPHQPKSFQPPTKGEAILVNGHYYHVGEKIGEGRFGAVYACSDEWSNPLVAKVLVPRDCTYEEIRESWVDELLKLQALRHPNITYVHAAFEHRHRFYLVMERCWSTLEKLIIPELKADIWIPYVARDILQGLEYIHGNGYVHKDMHPCNVFVSQSFDRMVPRDPIWSFKIGDLGNSRLERDIDVFNTVLAQWMLPPEAIDPTEFGPVGRTMDIYHTGLLLLALILGRVPEFTRDEILSGVPRKLAEKQPSKYGPVIAMALRRHATARIPTAMQFWREITGVR